MKGFTLIEIMVVLVIFTIISAAIFGVLYVGRNSWYIGTTAIELQQDTRRAMDAMARELRQSGSVTGVLRLNISGGGSVITFQIPVDGDTDGDVLDANGNLEWGAQAAFGWSIQYSLGGLNNRQLIRTVLDSYPAGNQVGEETTLANNIPAVLPGALVFTAIPAVNPTAVNIAIIAQNNTIYGRIMQSNLQSQVALRNIRN